MVFFYFSIVIIIGIIVIAKSDSKLLNLICFLLLAYVFSFNTDNNDYEAYLDFYNIVEVGRINYITNDAETSPLFSISMMLGKYLNMNFDIYRLFMFIICSLGIYTVVKDKICFGPFLFAYSLIIFFFDLVQIRFAFSEFFILYGVLSFLVLEKKIPYVLCVLLASLFHSMNVIFIIFLLFPYIENKINKIEKIIPWFFMGIIVFAIAGSSIILSVQNTASKFHLFSEYNRYLEQEVRYGYILYIAYQLGNYMFARYMNYSIKYNVNQFNYQHKLSAINYLIQTTGILFIIPTMLNVNFSRYMRVLLIINLFTFCAIIFATLKKEKRFSTINRKAIFMYLVIIAMWYIGETFANGAYLNIVERVFSSF